MNMNRKYLVIYFIILVLSPFIIFTIGCIDTREYELQEYYGPGYIKIEGADLTIEEANEISCLIEEMGFRTIISAAFDDNSPGFWRQESLYNDEDTRIGFGSEARHISCVSENFEELYWLESPTIAIIGRSLTQEDVIEHRRVCMVNRYLALNLFDSIESALGKAVTINGKQLEIVGVYYGTENFDIVSKDDIFMPYSAAPEISEEIYFVTLHVKICDFRDLSAMAVELFEMLNERGFDVSVNYLNGDFELINGLSPG